MKKRFLLLSLALCLCLLCGCMGTPVIYHANCDCPVDGTTLPADNEPVTQGALKTGLALVADISGSTAAEHEKNGEGKYDVTMVAVLVDEQGVIRDCIIDGIAAAVKFDTAGQITSDLAAAIQTKNELGDAYGMVQYGQARYEWNVQAEALAEFAVGKTAQQLRDGAIDETGRAPAGSDLASSATIYLGGYVSAIEEAAENAQYLGAQNGDTLKMAALASIAGSQNASGSDGSTQLEVTVTALTMNDTIITSCAIDSVQAKVSMDNKGAITSDLSAAVKSKNELGADYGMVQWGQAKFEWNEQAASFAKYVTGKTAAQVAGIAVSDDSKPADADLAASVTIAIGSFQALIEKAAK